MNNRFVPILPSSSSSSHHENSNFDSLPITSSSASLRKRDGNVLVACNGCRKKKIRCDGLRPTCSACEGKTEVCIYRDKSRLSKEGQKLLVEVIKLLNNVPQQKVSHVLGYLKGEQNASTILSILKKFSDLDDQIPDAITSIGKENPLAFLFELKTYNPNAYPGLINPGPEFWHHSQVRRLTSSNIAGSPTPEDEQGYSHDLHAPHLCDPRLESLDIGRWSTVPIESDIAARVISLYLETDHPLLGFFDPNLFIAGLINGNENHCSSLLVNALLYWACQMYSGRYHQMDSFTPAFCIEAESLWRSEKMVDSTLSLAALQFLSLGYLGQGRDHAVLSYLRSSCEMASRMGLYNSVADKHAIDLRELSTETAKEYSYAAWGNFNWSTLMSLFYRQPDSPGPKHPPNLPIPHGGNTEFNADRAKGSSDPESPSILVLHDQPEYMGCVFPYLCLFWRIMHDVSMAYHQHNMKHTKESTILRFAEFKFRELLAWIGALPPALSRDDNNSRQSQVLHLWFHTAVLDIFRPCLILQLRTRRLKTFSSIESSPEAIYAASVSQLKHLVLNFRLHFASSRYSFLWHTALTYLGNAILFTPKQEGWFFYFLLCVYGYERLCRSWRVTVSISTALLSMALRNGDVTSDMARRILHDIQHNRLSQSPGQIRAPFMADLDLEPLDPVSATVENQANEFEDVATTEDFTNVFNEPATAMERDDTSME